MRTRLFICLLASVLWSPYLDLHAQAARGVSYRTNDYQIIPPDLFSRNSNSVFSAVSNLVSTSVIAGYQPGTNILFTTNTGIVTINSTATGGGGGNTNNYLPGSNINFQTNGSNITISASGSGATNDFNTNFFAVSGAAVSVVTNRTLPNWVNVKDPPYNAPADGSDETTQVKTAYDAINKNLGGTLYFPPGRHKFNLVVTNENIHIVGSSGVKNYDNSVTNFFEPADVTKPVIQIGDDIHFCRGFQIKDASIQGTTGTAQVGIKLFGGAYEGSLEKVSVFNFYTNVWFEAGASLPCSLIQMDNVVIEPLATRVNARGVYIKMPDNQTSYTTSINWNSGHLNCPTNTGSFGIELDGTYLNLGTGFYLDGTSGHAIYINKSGTGQVEPVIVSAGFTLDVAGANIGINLYNNSSALDRVVGPIFTAALIQTLDGKTYPIPRNALIDGDRLYNPVIYNQLKLANDIYTNSGNSYLTADASDNVTLHAGANILVTPGVAGYTQISRGNILIANPAGLQWPGTNANYETVLVQTTGNNVQLASPTSGGYLQFVTRNPTNSGIQFLPEGVLTAQFDTNRNFNLYGANLAMDNNKGILLKDTGATGESVMIVTSGNNLALNSPTIGGSIQATVRKGDQQFQFLFGPSAIKPLEVKSNLLSFNAPIIYTNGAINGAFAKSDASGNMTWSLDGGSITNVEARLRSWTDLASGVQIDFAVGKTNDFYRLLTDNPAFTFINAVDGTRFRLQLEEDATGSRTPTFPSDTQWPQATNGPSTTPPGFSTNAGAVLEFEIERRNGTNYAFIRADRDSRVLTDIANGTATSAQIANQITDESGTGVFVMSTGGLVTNLVSRAQTNADLTASQAVFTDANKKLVSNVITGSGSVVMGTGPTIASPVVSAQTNSDLTASQAVFTDANKKLVSNALTGSGSVTMSTGASVTNLVSTAQTNSDLTASQAVFSDANKKLVSNALTGSGSVTMSTGALVTNLVVNGQTNSDLTASQTVVTDANKKLASVAYTGSGNFMRTRVGVVRSFDLPMGAWLTNGMQSPATPASWTNASDSLTFVDGSTNTARIKFALPINWDAGAIRAQLVIGSTTTNSTTSTNAVFGIKLASIGNGEFEDSLTFGTQVTCTNHVHRSPYKTVWSNTSDITPGNTPAANKPMVLELTRMTSDATDVNTNTLSLVSLQIFYTETATEPTMPAATN